MKIYRTVFQRPNTSVAFPPMNDGALAAHIQTAYTLSNPVKLLTIASEISQDLLTLIVTRTFATSADALEFSQDPQFIAWQATQEQSLTETGVVRANTFVDEA